MITALLNWFDHRVGYRELLQEALYERIPGGARWRYVWGSTLVFTFFLQVITGTCLWMAYSPGANTAWESVYYIQHEMTLGWVIRGIHHFAAQAMVILMVLHLMQVVIDGAYKAPREVNFWLGLVLAQIVMFLGLTGYLLPWDQKGYYATQVATEIMGSAPLVGPYVQKFMQGGSQYGHHTLTRFFALHAGILPATLIAFLGLHIYVFRRHGIKAREPVAATEGMFWPDQILKDAVACLAVLAAILTATWYWHGAELTAPANPAEAYAAARPEWYYLFLFKFLQYEWVSEMGEKLHVGEAFGAIFVPGAIATVFVLMPFLGRWKLGHYFNVSYMWVVMGIAGTLTGIAYYEDWYDDSPKGRDFRAAVEEAHLDGERAVALAQSPAGIPPEGAATLLRNDPLTQGPKLFKQYCIDCHQPAGVPFENPAQAPELVNLEDREQIRFASREWIQSVLTDFERHFQSLKGITGERQAQAEAILTGSMQSWSADNGPKLLEAENAADLAALTEFLYAQSRRPDALRPDAPEVLRGQEIFTSGKLTKGSIDACADCHTLRAVEVNAAGEIALQAEALSEAGLPTLTNYGGVQWLEEFLADPDKHYGENNAMPAFAEQLTPQQLRLLSRWLAEDYYVPGH
jgi:ubiquinol-cytochrome c reductase cytochrome b subunit